MIILLSPSKEMQADKPWAKNWKLKDESKEVLQALEVLDLHQLEKTLKVKGRVLEKNMAYIKAFNKEGAYPALELYNGLAFRQIDRENLDPGAREYLERHLRILSALYGPIGPYENIKPYRLDMTMALRVGGKSLKRFWRDYYRESFKKGEKILNLASDEFSCLLDKKNYQWMDFAFYERDKGKFKRHSTISKKGRGKMVSYLAENKIQDIEGIKNFDLDGYCYNGELSEENLLAFCKDGD